MRHTFGTHVPLFARPVQPAPGIVGSSLPPQLLQVGRRGIAYRTLLLVTTDLAQRVLPL